MITFHKKISFIILTLCIAVLNTAYTLAQDQTRIVESGDSITIVDQAELEKDIQDNRFRRKDIPIEILNRSIIQLLDIPIETKYIAWQYNNLFLENQRLEIDTSLWLNNLVFPQNKNYESFIHLGNLGKPSRYDHYFTRTEDHSFLFNRFLIDYMHKAQETKFYDVRSPFTILRYSSGGGTREAEQLLSVLHTQNVNKHVNFGIKYNYFGSKGYYSNQEVRNNSISVFTSYNKGNYSLLASISNNVFRQQENGGIVDHYFITDTLLEPRLVPVWLLTGMSIARERSAFVTGSYIHANAKELRIDSLGRERIFYKPYITSRVILNYENSSRIFSANLPSQEFFENFYISTVSTRDSVSQQKFGVKGVFELGKIKKLKHIPEFKGWFGYDIYRQYFFKPQDFIYVQKDEVLGSGKFGLTSAANYNAFKIEGLATYNAFGYQSGDNRLVAEITLTPWANRGVPQLKTMVHYSNETPHNLYNYYFSNHIMWDRDLDKERKLMVQLLLDIKQFDVSIGYNMARVHNFLYFDVTHLPTQVSEISISSLFVQNKLNYKGFNFFNRVVYQKTSNDIVLSLPNVIWFSAAYFHRELVKNVLVGQIGLNVTYRTNFYADAYDPSTGQFYNQRNYLIGNYPLADVFANFKWKRAIISVSYEHANKGYPNSSYFSTYMYPMNPSILKLGITWNFYD